MTKNEKIRRDYEREMLRSTFASLFWSVFMKRRDEGRTLKDIADTLRIHKSGVSRWFSGRSPNWELNTIADLANALDVDLNVTAIDRKSGAVFGASGEASPTRPHVLTRVNVMYAQNGLRRISSGTTGEQIDLREDRLRA